MASASDSNDALGRVIDAIADGLTIDWAALKQGGELDSDDLAVLQAMEKMRLTQSAATENEILSMDLEILGEIGRGKHGKVYRAVDRALGRAVALKVLIEDNGHARERFVQEARILASLDHHNIVRIFSIDVVEREIRLSLELIEGRTLDRILEEDGPLSPAEAAAIALDLCRALACIHAEDLVHGDVKPANVMRATGGRIVLLDFGVARSAHLADPDDLVELAGTPLFMAPEHLERGEPVVHASVDLYAIGVTLYRLVSKQYPYEALTQRELREQLAKGSPVPLLDRCPDVPDEFAAIVSRAIDTDSEQRFQSAGELAEALRSYLTQADGNIRRDEPTKRRVLASAGAKVLLAVTLALAVLAWTVFDGAWSRSPFELQARMCMVADGSTLEDGASIEVGDSLAMEVTTTEPCYVYIFNRDGAGHIHTLFPLEAYDLRNPLPAGTHRLPGPRNGQVMNWEVDTPGGGVDCFLVAAGREPVSEAELLRKEVPEAFSENAASSTEALGEESLAVFDRGVGKAVPAGPTAAEGDTTRLTEVFGRRVGQVNPDEVWKVIRLRNRSR